MVFNIQLTLSLQLVTPRGTYVDVGMPIDQYWVYSARIRPEFKSVGSFMD